METRTRGREQGSDDGGGRGSHMAARTTPRPTVALGPRLTSSSSHLWRDPPFTTLRHRRSQGHAVLQIGRFCRPTFFRLQIDPICRSQAVLQFVVLSVECVGGAGVVLQKKVWSVEWGRVLHTQL